MFDGLFSKSSAPTTTPANFAGLGASLKAQSTPVVTPKTAPKPIAKANKPGGIVGFLGDAFNNIGNFTAGINQAVGGGTEKNIVQAANFVGSGGNSKVATQRTNDFLKTTKQVNNKGVAPLAANADQKSPAFKAGTTAGNVVNFVNPTSVEPTVEGTVNQASAIQDVKNSTGGHPMDPLLDKAEKQSIEQGLKEGKISASEATAKEKQIDSRLASTNAATQAVESKKGIKINQTEGATDALSVLAGGLGLDGVAENVFKTAATKAESQLGRKLTSDEVTELADGAKKTVADNTKPVETDNSPAPVLETPKVKSTPEPISIKQVNGQADVQDLSNKAENSIRNNVTNVDPEKLTQAKQQLQTGTVKPIQVRRTPEGKIVIESGRHELQAAHELGIKNIPIQDISKPDVSAPEVFTQPTNTEISAPNTSQTSDNIKPATDTVSGNALRIQKKAVEQNLIDRTADLPEYKSINMKDQADQATDLVNNDRQKAIDIVDGKTNPPGDLKPLSVHQALEEAAIREGDGELLNKLADSHINVELSESAQNLRIAAERNPDSPVEKIRQINDTLAKASKKRLKTTPSKEVKAARAIVKKSTRINSKADLNDFIKELTC